MPTFAAAAAARAHGSRLPVQLEPVATGQGAPVPAGVCAELSSGPSVTSSSRAARGQAGLRGR